MSESKPSVRISMAVLVVALLAVSAAAADREPASNGEDTPAVTSVLDVPPPPGLDQEDLYEAVREVKRRGPATLEEVLAEIDLPAFLKAPPDEGEEEPDPRPAPPLEAQRAYAAGRLAMRSGARFEALRQLQKAARLAPQYADIHAALGELLAGSGDAKAARRHLEKAVELDPLRTHALYLLGKAALQANRHAEAAVLLHAAIERGPRDPRTDAALPRVARYHLAAALAGLDRPAAAAEQLERFHAEPRESTHLSDTAYELRLLDRRRDRTLRLLGDLYLRLDRPAEALKRYRMAAERSPEDVLLAARLLYSELLVGRRDRARDVAIALFRNARHRNDGVRLLNYLRERGVTNQSLIAELRAAYEDADRDTGAALALAELLPPDEARQLLRQHLAHRPDDTAAIVKLLRLTLGEAPDDADVLAAAETLAALFAEHPRRSPVFAEVFFRLLDDDERAARVLASTRDDGDGGEDAAGQEDSRLRPEFTGLAGLALARAGRADDARPLLEAALGARPELTAARIMLAQIAAAGDEVDRALELLREVGPGSPAPAISLKVRLLASREQTRQALDLLEAADLDGDKPALTTLRARLHLQQGEVERAEQLLLDALNADPEEERYYALLFELYDRDDAPPHAVDAYRRLLDRAMREIPEARVTRYRVGELHLVSRNYPRAEANLLPLVRRNPGDAEALKLLLETYAQSGREQVGTALLDRVLETEGDNPAVLELALEYYRDAGLQKRAAQVSIRLLEMQPSSPERDRQLAMAYLRDERYDRARALIDDLLEDDGDDPDNLYLAVVLHTRTGEEPQRIRMTERLLRARFEGEREQRALAGFYLQTGQVEKSVPLLEDLLDRAGDGEAPGPGEAPDAPGNAAGDAERAEQETAQLTLMLAHAYLRLDRAEDALALLEKAGDAPPAFASRLLYQRSRAHDQLGNADAAERDLLQAVERDPRAPGPRNALAYRWAQNNRKLDEALALAKRAVALEGDVAAFLDTLGWVHYKRGEFAQAIRWLERARVAEGGENPIIIDHLGDALYRSGRAERAVRAWQQAAELLGVEGKEWGEDPELEGLDQRLKRKIEALRDGGEPPAAVVPSGVSA